MKRLKLFFEQYIMITAGIVFGIAIESAVYRLTGTKLEFPWHLPLSVVVAGILGTLPSLLLVNGDAAAKDLSFRRVTLHFFIVFAAVALTGALFGWFDDLRSFLFVAAIFVCVYAFVWLGTVLVCMHDARVINSALRARDGGADDDDEEPPVALP